MIKNERGCKMALPIAPTPILRGKDVDKFNKMVEEGLKKGTVLPKLPNLDHVVKKHLEYVNRKKQNNK